MTGVSIIIPALNEEAGIGKVLKDLETIRARVPGAMEVIVVDDGSTDRTAELARAAGATVLSHPVNLGYGASLKRGISRASHDWIAMIDADGTYAANDLARLLERADGYDMLIGARQGAVYRGSLLRYPMRIVFRWLCAYVTGARVPDPNSGCRIFRKSVAMPYAPILSKGYSFTTSITMLFLLEGHLVGFLPINYTERIGRSKVRLVRDTLRSSQILLEIILMYNPLKAFLLFGAAPLAMGLWVRQESPESFAVLAGIAFLIWSLGGIAVLLSRRTR